VSTSLYHYLNKVLREESDFVQNKTFEGLLPGVRPLLNVTAEFVVRTARELVADE
jgi:hypothetical protein